MVAMKIPRPILKLIRSPIVVVSAASFGMRLGKDVYKMRKGEIDKKEFRARAGTHVGGTTGSMAGAAAGAAAFSMIPGVGTVLGAFAGGVLGEAIGAKLGRRAAERIEETMVDSSAKKEEPVANNDHGTHNPKRHL